MGASRSISPSDAPDFLTVRGDIAQPETAQMIVEQAVSRFGRVDSLINNAGIFISKPFTDYTLEDYLELRAIIRTRRTADTCQHRCWPSAGTRRRSRRAGAAGQEVERIEVEVRLC